ncbi:MAG TPA: hypothetical protein VNL38_02135 [Candidatus Nitrosotenuis sp.]|nr:hypothetical protein [Candidatus Nitrosotenuis sp.]
MPRPWMQNFYFGDQNVGMAAPFRDDWMPSDRPLQKRTPKTVNAAGARSGAPVAWGYGRHLLAGNVIFEGRSGSSTIVLLALGEGEWDSCEVLFINGVPFDITDTAKFHFHPGLDGEAGVETSPSTRNQKICSFFPTTFWPRIHFARTCYAGLALPPDSGAPNNEFRIQGIYKLRRMRIFDASGTQTGYAYSANYADCLLDLLIERFIKPRSRINEALTSGEKANFDFAAFDDFRSACAATVDGEARWELHKFWDSPMSLQAAVNEALLLARAYRVIKEGKWGATMDAARASVLTLGMDELMWPVEISERDLMALPNRIRLDYRDMNSGLGRGTISSSGTTVTGSGTDFTRWYKKDQALQVRSGSQIYEAKKIASVDSDVQITLAAAFSANQSAGTLHGNPWLDFQEASRVFEDFDLQDQSGLVSDENRNTIYCGGSTPKRVQRLGEYLLRRRAAAKGFRGRALIVVPGANDPLPGDRIVAPAKDDFTATRDWRITEIEELADGGRIFTADEYDETMFSDASGPQQPAAPALPDLHEAYNTYGFHAAGGGNIENKQYCSASTNTHSAGWRRLASGSIQLPKGVTKVLIRLTGAGTGTGGSLGYASGQNIGIAIGTGSPPSSPTVSGSIAETGGTVEVTYDNPPTEVAATIWLFIQTTATPVSAEFTALQFNANQNMYPLAVPGKVL